MEIKQRLAVLILFFEKAHQTIECVKSFLPSGVKIYILNNGSSDCNTNTVKRFCASYDQITVFRSDKNLGVSGGRNFLIENTCEEFLFFVDNDIFIKTDNWLEIARAGISKNPDAEAYIPRIFNVWEKRFLPFFSLDIINNKMVYHYMHESECGPTSRLNCFPGGASIISRGVFSKWGLYDDKMFVGFEDFEFALRAILAEKPLKVHFIQGIELIHNHLFAKNRKEKEAIRIRYHLESLEKSYNRIVEKHGVYLPNNWKPWTQKQIEVTTQRQLLKKLKNKVMCFVYGLRNILLGQLK